MFAGRFLSEVCADAHPRCPEGCLYVGLTAGSRLHVPVSVFLQYVSVLYAEAGSAAGVDGGFGGHHREQRISPYGGQGLIHHQEAQLASPRLDI